MQVTLLLDSQPSGFCSADGLGLRGFLAIADAGVSGLLVSVILCIYIRALLHFSSIIIETSNQDGVLQFHPTPQTLSAFWTFCSYYLVLYL